MSIKRRNNVVVKGSGTRPMLFAHGFGCDQNMWRYVSPAFEENYQVILFDQVGSGQSDLAAYDTHKYAQLEGYASDIVEIARELNLRDVIFVGHSVSAIIGALASLQAPGLFSSLVMVSPSPSYINDGNYNGGFSRLQIDELLDALDSNHLGWSLSMAPVIMGNADRPELGDELANSFCKTDPAIIKQFARATFLSDMRSILPSIQTPTLILQCSEDVIAPQEVGEYMHEHLQVSTLVILDATGHCPNLSAPEETTAAIKQYLINAPV